MFTSHTASRSAGRVISTQRNAVLNRLKEDHRCLKSAYREFQRLDLDADSQACGVIVNRVLQELSVHAVLEQELLYPAARSAIADESFIDEAEVEHESVHNLIEQLRDMGPADPKYAARFTVLCEYMLHHVDEEEGEIFPQLEGVRLDWAALGAAMDRRRARLMFTAEVRPTPVAAPRRVAITGVGTAPHSGYGSNGF